MHIMYNRLSKTAQSSGCETNPAQLQLQIENRYTPMLTLQTLGFKFKPIFPAQAREGKQETKTSTRILLFRNQMTNELGKIKCLAVFGHDTHQHSLIERLHW